MDRNPVSVNDVAPTFVTVEKSEIKMLSAVTDEPVNPTPPGLKVNAGSAETAETPLTSANAMAPCLTRFTSVVAMIVSKDVVLLSTVSAPKNASIPGMSGSDERSALRAGSHDRLRSPSLSGRANVVPPSAVPSVSHAQFDVSRGASPIP